MPTSTIIPTPSNHRGQGRKRVNPLDFLNAPSSKVTLTPASKGAALTPVLSDDNRVNIAIRDGTMYCSRVEISRHINFRSPSPHLFQLTAETSPPNTLHTVSLVIH